jgi:hypothetical protein
MYSYYNARKYNLMLACISLTVIHKYAPVNWKLQVGMRPTFYAPICRTVYNLRNFKKFCLSAIWYMVVILGHTAQTESRTKTVKKLRGIYTDDTLVFSKVLATLKFLISQYVHRTILRKTHALSTSRHPV